MEKITIFNVTGWKNGKHNDKNTTYGIAIKKSERSSFISKKIKQITIQIDGFEDFTVDISDKFWENCNEFRHRKIKEWMTRENLIPWKNGKPPKLKLTRVEKDVFKLSEDK
jgi:hypothetical protein